MNLVVAARGKRSIDVIERRARLGVRHRLAAAQHTDDVVQITDDLVALHSSDPVTVYLSAAARMKHPAFEPVANALYEDRTLVRHHAMRRTLWVFSPEIARLAHASTTTGLLKQQRKVLRELLEATGIVDDPDAWVAQARADTLAALRRLGPTPARRLGKEVPALGVKLQLAVGKPYGAEIAAHTRVLLLLGFEGEIVRTKPTGTWINSEYHWTATDTWLEGGLTGADPADAAAALARRWLRAFGPATTADLQWWTGWTGSATKAALAHAGATEVDLDGSAGWVDAGDDKRVSAPKPWVALLPGLDPTTMGWKQRDWYLPADHVSTLFDRNGNAGPTVWADGQVVGGWVQRPSGEIAIRMLSDVGVEQRAAIDRKADDLRSLLGSTRFRSRFPAPLQAELLR
jgi:winged helix DNA-binding protein